MNEKKRIKTWLVISIFLVMLGAGATAAEHQKKVRSTAVRRAHPFGIWDGTTDPKWAQYLGELKLAGPFPGQAGQRPVSVGLTIGGKVATVTSLIPAAKCGKDVHGDRAEFPSRRIETVGGRVTVEVSEEAVLVEQASDAPERPLPKQKRQSQAEKQTSEHVANLPRQPTTRMAGQPSLPGWSATNTSKLPVYLPAWDHMHPDKVNSPTELKRPEKVRESYL